MHVASVKAKSDRQTDGPIDRQMDDEQSDTYMALCFADATKRYEESY